MNPESRPVIDHDAELLACAESVVYKQPETGDGLVAHVFFPDGERAGARRAAILFFHGGDFESGKISQFAPQALYFSGRGAVAILVGYRTRQSHGASPLDAMRDARSAVRWARYYAGPLGIDPDRVVVAGALSGGTLAAATAMKSDLTDDDTDPPGIDGVPGAAVLFSPILEIAKDGYGSEAFARSGVEPAEASLSARIEKGLPPILILHGTEDRVTPMPVVEKFVSRMRKKRNLCELIPFEGRQHSFYNLNVNPALYDCCNAEMDHFLVETGFLEAAPETAGSDVGEVKEIP